MPPSPIAAPPQTLNASRTIWSVHYLRGLAALGVVVFHSLDGTQWPFAFGAEGIHLFFTISGFMMWTIAADRDVRARPFIWGRITRIVPLYWLATATAVLSTYWMPGFFWQASRSPGAIVQSLLFIPQAGAEGGVYPVLYQGWTLQYEMYYYLLFSLTLLFRKELRLWILASMFMALAAIGTVLQHSPSPLVETYTDPICLEFLAGSLAAELVRKRMTGRQASALAVFGVLAFAAAHRFEAKLLWFSPVALAIGTSAVLQGLVQLEQNGKMIRSAALRRLGEASYSIYLFQTLGFALVARMLPNLSPVLQSCAYVFAALAVGFTIYSVVEKPLLTRAKEWRRARSVVRQNAVLMGATA